MPRLALWCAGFDVLTAMERVPVDGDDRPEREIKITGGSVFVDPYKDMEEEERQKADAERKQAGSMQHALGYDTGYQIPCLSTDTVVKCSAYVMCYPLASQEWQ